jgi:hypothetical protein
MLMSEEKIVDEIVLTVEEINNLSIDDLLDYRTHGKKISVKSSLAQKRD